MGLSVGSSRLALALPALAFGFAGAARAADMEAKSRIDGVIVYPDAAAVTRAADVDLPAGATTLIFKNLPIGLDPASLRVEGAGAGKISIGAVEARLSPAAGPARDSAIEAKLKSLRSDREGWQASLDALEAKKAMIIRFSQAGPEKLSPDSSPLDIAQWPAAWDAVGQGLAKIGDELRAARARARDLDDEINGLEQAKQRPAPQATASRDASVQINADAAMSGQIKLTYRVAGAGWRPVYDARLDTGGAGGKPVLDLVRRASVTQRTGEDWTNVALTVSTIRARNGVQAPEVYTRKLVFWEQPQPYAAAVGGLRAAPQSVAAAPAPDVMAKSDMARRPEPGSEAAPPQRPAEERQAALDSGAFQASFQIADRVDIAADGSSKSFRISSATLNPDLIVRVAPALDATAYLQAHIVNGEDAPLLPGDVNISRDGTFVGVGHVGLVAPGDATDLGFGADDRVKVTRIPVRRKENEPTWFGSTKTETREFKTTVKNLHVFSIKTSVIDRAPISENTAIVVEQLPQTTPPTDKTVNDRRGVMGWTFDLAPGDSKDIRLAYRMKWPADRDVISQIAPDGTAQPTLDAGPPPMR